MAGNAIMTSLRSVFTSPVQLRLLNDLFLVPVRNGEVDFARPFIPLDLEDGGGFASLADWCNPDTYKSLRINNGSAKLFPNKVTGKSHIFVEISRIPVLKEQRFAVSHMELALKAAALLRVWWDENVLASTNVIYNPLQLGMPQPGLQLHELSFVGLCPTTRGKATYTCILGYKKPPDAYPAYIPPRLLYGRTVLPATYNDNSPQDPLVYMSELSSTDNGQHTSAAPQATPSHSSSTRGTQSYAGYPSEPHLILKKAEGPPYTTPDLIHQDPLDAYGKYVGDSYNGNGVGWKTPASSAPVSEPSAEPSLNVGHPYTPVMSNWNYTMMPAPLQQSPQSLGHNSVPAAPARALAGMYKPPIANTSLPLSRELPALGHSAQPPRMGQQLNYTRPGQSWPSHFARP